MVCVVDVIDAATSAEVALETGASAVLGAAPAAADAPVAVDPAAVGRHAAALATEAGSGVVVVAEPRIGPDELRATSAALVLEAIRSSAAEAKLVANQGAELPALARLKGQVVVVVSATGGTAYDAALRAGAPGVCFATTARIEGRSGWEVARLGAERAANLAREHGVGLSVVAASANSLDDCMAAFEVARILLPGR